MFSPTLPNPENESWLTPKQAAQRLGVSVSLIYKLIITNNLKASRVGSKLIRIKLSDLMAIYRPASKSTSQEVNDSIAGVKK